MAILLSGTFQSLLHLVWLLIQSTDARETGAIILYLIDTYDTEYKISVADPREKAILTQWLFFQTTGQG